MSFGKNTEFNSNLTEEESRMRKGFTVPRVYPNGAIYAMQIFFNEEYRAGILANRDFKSSLWHESTCAILIHEMGHALGASHDIHCPIMNAQGVSEETKQHYVVHGLLPESTLAGMQGLYAVPGMAMCAGFEWPDQSMLTEACHIPGLENPEITTPSTGCSCQSTHQRFSGMDIIDLGLIVTLLLGALYFGWLLK